MVSERVAPALRQQARPAAHRQALGGTPGLEARRGAAASDAIIGACRIIIGCGRFAHAEVHLFDAHARRRTAQGAGGERGAC